MGVEAANTAELQAQVVGRAVDMSFEQREKRKLAKRILKAVQPSLEDALRKEGELNGRPFAQQIKEMDEMLFSRRASLADSLAGAEGLSIHPGKLPNGTSHSTPSIPAIDGDVEMIDHGYESKINGNTSVRRTNGSTHGVPMRDIVDEDGEDLVEAGTVAQLNGELTANAEQTLAAHTPPASTNGIKREAEVLNGGRIKKHSPAEEPPTPPISLEGNQHTTLAYGGIPWYVEQFDPEGTTIHDERWTGPEVLREMSEELSEMDDDELQDLGGADFEGDGSEAEGGVITAPSSRSNKLKKNGKQKKRWKGFR